MQQAATAKLGIGSRGAGVLVIASLLGGLIGCDGPSPQSANSADKPYAGASLTLHCPDREFARAITPMVGAWAARTGADVVIRSTGSASENQADCAVVDFADLGTLADQGDLLTVPTRLKGADNSYQWLGVLSAYQGERFVGWGGQTFGLPLAGDSAVLVIRTDRLEDPNTQLLYRVLTGKELTAPTTWEDLIELAAFFTHIDGRPSLPGLAADPVRLAELFYRIAACYDRPAQSAAQSGTTSGAFSFQFDTQDGTVRLDQPGFRIAATRLAQLGAAGGVGRPANPVAALLPTAPNDRGAVFAVATLADVAALRQGDTMPGRFGVAALPGGRVEFDAKGQPRVGERIDELTMQPVPITAVNYVPCLTRGKIGVVRTRCSNPDAAFDLLAELGAPARSLELVGSPGVGAGPFRDIHLERDRLIPWLVYGFGNQGSAALQDAARRFVAREVRNPAYGLREPDHAALDSRLATELTALVAGTVSPDEAMKRAAEAWRRNDPGVPTAKQLEWRRRAAGLN